MLRSFNQLYGHTMAASEGEIGSVLDFYFDDEEWAIRYVVADSGNWLSGRRVLLSPHAFGDLYADGDSLLVNLSRKQIEESPSIDTHKPVSRQYEEEYFGYYGWPTYWKEPGMQGAVGLPVAPPPHLFSLAVETADHRIGIGDDPHLRSSKDILGYHVHSIDEAIGHVTDFTFDDKTWKILQVIIETGHWYAGRKISLGPEHVKRISYEDSTVFVNVSKQSLIDAAETATPKVVRHDFTNATDER